MISGLGSMIQFQVSSRSKTVLVESKCQNTNIHSSELQQLSAQHKIRVFLQAEKNEEATK